MFSVILICGLPASGKSSFSQKLQNFYHQKNIQIELIEYDQWELLSSNDELFDRERWKENRVRIMAHVRGLIEQAREEEFVIVLDDNFYLRSMRKCFYQIVREYEGGFVQLFLDVPVEMALERNRMREVPVRDEVIGKMDCKFEWPGRHWEEHSIVIEVDEMDSFDKLDFDVLEMFRKDVILPLINERDDKNSAIHEIDIESRKKVSEIIKILRGRQPNVFKSKLEEISECRLMFIDKLRAKPSFLFTEEYKERKIRKFVLTLNEKMDL